MKIRGFELIEGLNGELPIKATIYSAGADFIASADVKIPPFKVSRKATLIPTGVKAYMRDDEHLLIYARSSLPIKLGLIMSNGVGVVDSDYYNNPKNEGHVMLEFHNMTDKVVVIKKGERIGQGIFQKTLPIDDRAVRIKNEIRKGGFGSSGK